MKKLLLLVAGYGGWCLALPTAFDLRNANGHNYVTSVKNQSGGTCWTFGTMSSVESNLTRTGTWATIEAGEAAMATYHLDWWNGFNRNWNADIAPRQAGLTVHQGGDYRVAAAYLTRGDGAVRANDGNGYSQPSQQRAASYHYYMPHDIEWYTVGRNLEGIDVVKQALMDHGAVGTAIAWSDEYYSGGSFYVPPTASDDPNHSVSIVGWDDTKRTRADQPGAWLVKNSWGSNWGNRGLFWLSYYDKFAAHHPDMGAVSFQNVGRNQYLNIYGHDFHGWRDTRNDVREAFNAYVAKQTETLKSVGIYTTDENVEYTVRVHLRFEKGELHDTVSYRDGVLAHRGFHTIDLRMPFTLVGNQKFYVSLRVSRGGLAYDKTSDVPVLLCGPKTRVVVESKASPGESYYRKNGAWVDLNQDDKSANFCIKALTVPAR